MKESTFLALQSLKDALEEDERLRALESIERSLEASEEVRALSMAAKKSADDYDLALSRGKESPFAMEKQRELFIAKKALDEHPLCRQYAKAYREVRLLYGEIDLLLLSPFRLETAKKGCPHA